MYVLKIENCVDEKSVFNMAVWHSMPWYNVFQYGK